MTNWLLFTHSLSLLAAIRYQRTYDSSLGVDEPSLPVQALTVEQKRKS